MLEEILEANYALENTNTIMINKNELFEILDKYQDKYKERSGLSKQEVDIILNKKIAYKNAWEDLFNRFSEQSNDELYLFGKEEMQKLEKIHNIGSEDR